MDEKGKIVLITGSGGFIGSHVVELLLSQGYNVRAFLRYTSHKSKGWLSGDTIEKNENLELLYGDIRDSGAIERAVEGSTYVLHLAALIGIPYSYIAPGDYVAVNIGGTLNVLEACRRCGIERLVHTSTSENYGTAQYIPIDEKHPLVAQSPYSASKIAADKIVESYNLSFDIPVVTLRPFNTFGPRQSLRAVIPSIITQLLSHPQQLEIGALDTKRDFTYVTDVAEGFLKSMITPDIEGELIQLGTGTSYSIKEIINIISAKLDIDPELKQDSERLRPERSEVLELLSDYSKATEKMGWRPEISFENGIDRVIKFFRENPPEKSDGSFNL